MDLSVGGRDLNALTAPLLERKLSSVEAEEKSVLLDFNSIDYLSSAGIRVLLAAGKKWKAQHQSFVLFSLQDSVRNVIKMAGLEKVFTICLNEKEGLKLK